MWYKRQVLLAVRRPLVEAAATHKPRVAPSQLGGQPVRAVPSVLEEE